MKLYDLDPGPDSPEIVRVIIEIPKNSSNKYEYDGELEVFRLDRALDRDPLDIIVLVNEPSFTGCLMEARPVGVLNMIDSTEMDKKILAVPNRNPRFDSVHTLDQVFPHTLREIEYFFSIYKDLQGCKTTIDGFVGPREARRVIAESRQAYLDRRIQQEAQAMRSAGQTALVIY